MNLTYDEDDCQVLEDGVDRYTQVLLREYQQMDALPHGALTKLFEPVYITNTSMKLIGNQAFASFQSNARNDIMPIRLTRRTDIEQTEDCIARRRKVMEKCAPDTTNCLRVREKVRRVRGHTLC